MKLGIKDRIYLSEILQGYECPLVRIGAVKRLLELTEFTAEELDYFGIIQLPNGEIRWALKEGVSPEIEISYSDKQIALVASILGQHPRLSSRFFSLLEKFGVKIPTEE